MADIYIAIGEPEKAEEILQRAEKALKGDTEKTEEKKEEVQEAKKQKEAEATPTDTPAPTPEVTPTDVPTPMPTPTNTPIPTPTGTSDSQVNLTKVELKLGSDCFTYDTHYSKYVCMGLSEKGYAEYKKYSANYLVSIQLPAVSDTGREVYGFRSNSNGGYDLTEMLTENSANVELVCPENYTIYYGIRDNYPDSKYIGKLKNVVLSHGLETIGSSAFYRCSGVTEIKLPTTLETIENLAFYQCSALKEIKIPEGVKEIGSSAFEQCEGLRRVEIPETVVKFGGVCFQGART